ncbi:hypothetical protein BDQ12DRAFT_671414 [Crucibulum laeve]|uniref:Uncharacterized protein n=1 Tax=Crucibulum laeve TaxID=68775 RepID=A0A5C3LTB5_9AGAR|nr:hypothetical protein BDQ12DRAFT_671414 [Crucibulum laeve]
MWGIHHGRRDETITENAGCMHTSFASADMTPGGKNGRRRQMGVVDFALYQIKHRQRLPPGGRTLSLWKKEERNVVELGRRIHFSNPLPAAMIRCRCPARIPVDTIVPCKTPYASATAWFHVKTGNIKKNWHEVVDIIPRLSVVLHQALKHISYGQGTWYPKFSEEVVCYSRPKIGRHRDDTRTRNSMLSRFRGGRSNAVQGGDQRGLFLICSLAGIDDISNGMQVSLSRKEVQKYFFAKNVDVASIGGGYVERYVRLHIPRVLDLPPGEKIKFLLRRACSEDEGSGLLNSRETMAFRSPGRALAIPKLPVKKIVKGCTNMVPL